VPHWYKTNAKKISSIYTSRNLTRNIRIICRNCEVCIKNKSRGQDKLGLMSHLGPATKPFEIVSIDTIGGFGDSRSTKRYLHLLVDHFTRFAFISTSKTQSTKDFVKLITRITDTDDIDMLLTDQYPGINTKEFKDFLEEKSIIMIFTAVNAPFSNGLNERLNQTLTNKIRCKMNERGNKKAWTTIAQECVNKYNDTEHTVTGFAPRYLLYGTDVTLIPKELKQEAQKENWIKDRETAIENTRRSHAYNKSLFDKNRRNYNYKIGDMVYVENGNRLNRRKLDELNIGPYKITEKISDSIYKLNTGHRKEESNFFHIIKLIPVPIRNIEEKD